MAATGLRAASAPKNTVYLILEEYNEETNARVVHWRGYIGKDFSIKVLTE